MSIKEPHRLSVDEKIIDKRLTQVLGALWILSRNPTFSDRAPNLIQKQL